MSALYYPEEVCRECKNSIFKKCPDCGKDHLCMCLVGAIEDIDSCKGKCEFRKEKRGAGFESFECEVGTIEVNPVKTRESTCPKCGRTRQIVDLHDDEEKDEVMIEYCPFCKESC